jgi:hypothetical protein
MRNLNIVIDSLFLFIYICVLLFIKFPNINSDNYIKHKLIFFTTIFVFTFLTNIITLIKKACKIDAGFVAIKSLYIGTVAVIAYSIYLDLTIMNWSKEYFINKTNLDTYKSYALISFTVVMSVLLFRLFNLLISNKEIECNL